MAESDDMRLVSEYASGGSQEAFAELVARHGKAVDAGVRAHLGDVDEVQDVAQTVFILLANKAGRLSKKTRLPGWLHRAAWRAAIRHTRTQQRRMSREQEAFMQSMNDQHEDPSWTELKELLHDGMDRLRETEQEAVLARYFERLSVPEAAASLRITEAALKKRLTRGIEQLRKFYAARGVRVSAQGLAGSITANAVQPLSPELFAKLCAIGVHKGAGCSPAVQALAKSTMRALDWLRFKAIATWSAAVVLAVGSGTLAVREAVARPEPAPAALAGTWRIEGEAREMTPPAFATPRAVSRFVITLNGSGQWHLRGTASPTFSQVSEMGWDGTNLYTLSHNASGTVMIDGHLEGYTDSAQVYPQPMYPFSPRVACIWWALCSQSVLGQEGERSCPNFFAPLPENTPLITRQSLSTNLLRLGLEESKAYLGQRPGSAEPPSYALRVVETGEVNGILYPRLVRIQQFGRDSSVISAHEVVCSSVEPVEPPETYVPQLVARTSVTDHRLSNLRTEYVTTNWYSPPEVQRLVSARTGVSVASAPALPRPAAPTRTGVRIWALLGFTGISLFFLRFVFVRPRYY
jgi:RNA polymerase sigma factor (sigma-70 family)